jgi:predicted O-linked N-acetylglucosamine transferase (SPINDLY family)
MIVERLQEARALAAQQRWDLVEVLCRQVLESAPQEPDALLLLGDAQAVQLRPAEAAGSYESVLRIDPACLPALFNHGTSLLALGEFRTAAEQFRRCAQLRPEEAGIYNNLGVALAGARDFDGAIAAYDRALALQPDYARALNNRGLAEHRRRCHARAVLDFDRALALQPGYRAALVNRGMALRALGQTEAALESSRAAFPLPEALASAVELLRELHRGAEAVECGRQLMRSAPQMDDLPGSYHAACQGIADWSDYTTRLETIIAGVQAGRRPARPFVFLSVTDAPADQLLCARAHAATLRGGDPLWRGMSYEHSRIRVGYLSSDFKTHATSHLAAGLFERHDRGLFECFALSHGSCAAGDPMRARLERAFEHFHDVESLSIQQLAAHVRALEIDVLVDLKGYTAGSRLDVLSHRPAPIQAHYLGYPGTLGAPFVDYLIADRAVIPASAEAHYSERLVFLPHCYQATDDRRSVSSSEWSRQRAELPARGAVLCAFHQTYKITPALWQVWMRLLARIPDATLWLLAADPAASAHLAAEARNRGIDPRRLVFAPRLEQAEHLGRLRLADLFLDTGPVGAHTTASDALWVGVPVVALAGRAFAARVSTSILTAAGLGDCVAASLPEYETLAERLLTEPERLAALRRRIESEVRDTPLFDTESLTRALEACYVAMWERHRSGLNPASMEIHDDGTYTAVN